MAINKAFLAISMLTVGLYCQNALSVISSTEVQSLGLSLAREIDKFTEFTAITWSCSFQTPEKNIEIYNKDYLVFSLQKTWFFVPKDGYEKILSIFEKLRKTGTRDLPLTGEFYRIQDHGKDCIGMELENTLFYYLCLK